MNRLKYLEAKRLRVLDAIKPIMTAFKINDYDYIVKNKLQTETLKINSTFINCSCNSIDAIIDEVVCYLVVYRKIKDNVFSEQTKNILKQFWLNEQSIKDNEFDKMIPQKHRNNNMCVVCGSIIPEGTQICPIHLKK